jgi:hypothetical protein
MSVIVSPNGAAIMSEEQNCRNERRLTPQALNRSSIVPRSIESTTGDPVTGIPQDRKAEIVCLVPKGLTKASRVSLNAVAIGEEGTESINRSLRHDANELMIHHL